MSFSTWRYLYPPRPEQAVLHNMLPFYEKRGYVAQFKMNGTCNVIGACGSDFKAMSRHEDAHKAWTPTQDTTALLQRVSGGKWIVVVSELLHSKVPGIKDVNYINDILVYQGEALYGTTFQERLNLLNQIFGPLVTEHEFSHGVIDQHWWLAATLHEDFQETFRGLSRPEHEGLVLKDPKARLMPCVKGDSNSRWMVKCRRVTKNLAF